MCLETAWNIPENDIMALEASDRLIDIICQLAYQKLLKPWHHFLEFSKLFKGTVNLVYVNVWLELWCSAL